ncbi:hypothetical protein QUC31_002388 [Theobroma cacao]
MIERGKPSAKLRLVIVKGKVHKEKFGEPYEPRDLFMLWGILQLLRFYPGKLPKLDLLFFTGDKTRIKKTDYQGSNATSPPPLFHYCGEEEALNIVFLDWTFWGWAEVNIMPCEHMLSAIKNGNKRIKWEDRIPYAYWKGNPYNSLERKDLRKSCSREGLWREYLEQSMVKSPSDKLPCTLPSPYEPQALQASLDQMEKITTQVEEWQTEY